MRTFQFSDAKSHKFWSIEVSGNSFTVTYGKVGTAGQTQTKSFPSAEKAQADADKLIREKTGKGYRETTPKAEVSQAEAFEAGLLDHPYDIARWSAYSDYLTEQGDPRGEFMRVQLALEDESLSAPDRKKLKKAEADLLKAHEREWLGPLAEFTIDGEKETRWRPGGAAELPPVIHEFERGWLRRLEFHRLTVEQARALSRSPEARMLRELVVLRVAHEARVGGGDQYTDSHYTPGPDVPADADEYDGPALHALCRCSHLGAVRTFVLGDPNDQCHTPGQLGYHLLKQMPRIEEVGFYARRVDTDKVFALPMPHLRSLTVCHITSYPLDKLAANKSLTKLGTLDCFPHAMEYDDAENGAYIRLEHLRAICRSPHLTSLDSLSLRLTDFGDAGARELVESGMLGRLRVLNLYGGCLSDEGAEVLAASKQLKKLESLDLGMNALTPAGVRRIEATGVKASLGEQHTTTVIDPDDTPEYLYHGDME